MHDLLITVIICPLAYIVGYAAGRWKAQRLVKKA